MRIFAVSDLHVDFEENARWVEGISNFEFVDDLVILAGDVSNVAARLLFCFEQFKKKFRHVFFVPGNHELWVNPSEGVDSLEKFFLVIDQAHSMQVMTQRMEFERAIISPLFSWYDFSFGLPDAYLLQAWVDFRLCVWPTDWVGNSAVCDGFLAMNDVRSIPSPKLKISFSHFLPRIDVMPVGVPADKRRLYPVLGSIKLDAQVRALKSDIHIYGHSHVNRDMNLEGVRYVNNAFAYPSETRISRKRLVEIA